MINLRFVFGICTLIGSFFCLPSSGQDFNKIKPLVSKCIDVKKALYVPKCDYPVSNFEFSDFQVNITFAGNSNRWKVSKDTVVEVIVVLRRLIPVNDFAPSLDGYRTTSDSDIPGGLIYRNDAKGKEFVTQKILNDSNNNKEYITSIRFFPMKSKRKE